jgi:hypothetical protein
MLFGNYHEGKIVAFADHYAAHGGAGKQMTGAFFLSKEKIDLKNAGPDQLYDYFIQYQQ